MENYFKDFESLLSQLTSLGSRPDEEQIMQYVINTLSKAYDRVVQGLIGVGLPSYDDFNSTLKFEESKCHMQEVSRTSKDALLVRTKHYSKRNFKSSSDRKSGICHYCGKPSHWSRQCRVREAHIKKLGVDRKNKLLNQKMISTNILEENEEESDQENEAVEEILEAALNSLDINERTSSSWILDSGAT